MIRFDPIGRLAVGRIIRYPHVQLEHNRPPCIHGSILIINHLKSYFTLKDKPTMVEEPVPTKPSAALDWIGFLVIIVGFFLAVGSIRFTGWIDPTNLQND